MHRPLLPGDFYAALINIQHTLERIETRMASRQDLTDTITALDAAIASAATRVNAKIDALVAQLNAQQQADFAPEVNAIKADITNLAALAPDAAPTTPTA